MILVIGAFLGFFSVGFGAYSEHALREVVTEEHFRFLMTAIRYNQVHAVIISALGLLLLSGSKLTDIPYFRWSAKLFILGTLLFSFSIYFSVLLDITEITYATPVGGTILMVAWFVLLWAGRSAAKFQQ